MAQKLTADLCIYAATSGGVIAAIAAAREGLSVLLVEPGRHLGGMTSGGLGITDFGDKRAIGGLSREFYARVEAHYAHDNHPGDFHTAGPSHPEGRGWTHEPHVAEQIFGEWLATTNVRVLFNSRIASAEKSGSTLLSITLDLAPPDDRGAPLAEPIEANYLQIEARQFIDASYEGDLMARAGVSYTVTRESRDQYDEELAGAIYSKRSLGIDAFVRPGDPSSGRLPYIRDGRDGAPPGSAGSGVQSYTFRLCLVQNAGRNQGNWRELTPPEHYDPADYEFWGRRAENLKNSPLTVANALYHYPPHYRPPPYHEPRLFKITPVPAGKTDVNHLNFFGASEGYPEGNWAARRAIWLSHQDYQRGLFHYFRTEPRVDADIRAEIAKWGLPLDEYQDTGNWPHQLYIREARRMLGRTVITQNDCEHATAIDDAIGLASHQLDSHPFRIIERDGLAVFEGGFFKAIPGPYAIPYRAITPRESDCGNLLVLFCLSSTHAAYSSVRMEPVLMVLGHSAAIAAAMAIRSGSTVQNVHIGQLRATLDSQGQLTQPPTR